MPSAFCEVYINIALYDAQFLKRHRIRTNQFQAMEEIINLAIEDPHARVVLAGHNIDHYLTPKFKEPDLILSTSRALGSIENSKVHGLWTGVLLGRLSEFNEDIITLYTAHTSSDSGFSVDGIQCLRQVADYYFDPEPYIRLYDVDKIHSYFRELRLSLRFVYI